MTQEDYPGVPIFILGHSFGSFIAREYITRYGTGIKGAIIQGTAFTPQGTLNFTKFLVNVISLFMGDKYRSSLINGMAFKGYLKNIPGAKSKFDWLSHNEECIQKNEKDPSCNFVFTMNGFKTIAELLKRIQDSSLRSRCFVRFRS